MREVRMTFGEHLEELRLRVFISLLYLIGGVAVAFYFGDTLLGWALRPHEQAYAGALKNRLVARMDKATDELTPLYEGRFADVEIAGRRLADSGRFHWETLFPAAVTKARVTEAVLEPYDELDRVVQGIETLSVEERRALGDGLRRAGHDVAERLIAHLATDLELRLAASLPERFDAIEMKLRALAARDDEGAAGAAKRLAGWGVDLAPVVESLEKFNHFLDLQREEVKASPATLRELSDWSKDFRLVEGLDDICTRLESSVEQILQPSKKPIQVIDYTEHFTSYLKISMIFGLFISIPFILYELWKFVGAGLHAHEQRYVVTFMPFSLLLFVCGVLFGYFIMIPVGLEFLASWGDTEVEMNFVLGNYIGLFLTLTLILGLVFQTPLLMVFLFKIGVTSVDFYRRIRRISIFVSVCLAVVLTPPDPFSWFLMAVPMIGLYELGILVCALLKPRGDVPEGSS